MIKDIYIKPLPSYQCQYASRDKVSFYISQTGKLNDPLYKSFGFDTESDYDFWSHRLCGIACLKMVLDAYNIQTSMALLTKEAIDLKGYILYEDNVFVDKGWYYQPLIEVMNKYGFTGDIFQTNDLNMLKYYLDNNHYIIASVHPQVIRLEIEESIEKGGHLVLLVGYRSNDDVLEGFYINNPSGIDINKQEGVFIPINTFIKAFAGKGFLLKKEM